MMKTAGAGLFFMCAFIAAFPLHAAPLRSLDAIFPRLSPAERQRVFSYEGLWYSSEKDSLPRLTPAPNAGINIRGVVMGRTPTHMVEVLLVIPHSGRELGTLDAYNAIGKIRDIKNHLYFSRAQNKSIAVFKETTRIESAKKRTPAPDPPPASRLPPSETMYLRFDDASFGTLYIQGDISASAYGITYDMTNFAAIRFLFFTIMKAEKFSTVVYLEPVEEGILVYGIAGVEIPGFVAHLINVSDDIEMRFMVLLSWLTEGLKK